MICIDCGNHQTKAAHDLCEGCIIEAEQEIEEWHDKVHQLNGD